MDKRSEDEEESSLMTSMNDFLVIAFDLLSSALNMLTDKVDETYVKKFVVDELLSSNEVTLFEYFAQFANSTNVFKWDVLHMMADVFRLTVSVLTKRYKDTAHVVSLIEDTGVFNGYLRSLTFIICKECCVAPEYNKVRQVKLQANSEDRRIVKLLMQGVCDLMRVLIISDRSIITITNQLYNDSENPLHIFAILGELYLHQEVVKEDE